MPNLIYVLLLRLRAPLIVLVLVYAISILGLVLIPGKDDQGNTWYMDFFHAFYFVSFMGSTIGFGEIPYAFTPPQRLWTTICIYATVIAWLYGIGALVSTMQDAAFRRLMRHNAFVRRVRGLTDDFYMICGFGDTGRILAQALAHEGIHSVVIDQSEERIATLEIDDFGIDVLGMEGDSANPQTLLDAGLRHRSCKGIVALTNDDEINLKIALTGFLLRPKLPIIVRAEHERHARNIASFGDNRIIDPFYTFAEKLALAFHSPGAYLLFDWVSGVPYEKLQEPLYPPKGKWILCSYGRFGRAVYEELLNEGIIPVIVEANIEVDDALDKVVVGDGTEASTLLEAGIKDAVGIVAGTDKDANNLSILMTAKELNPHLFTIARQNRRRNTLLFQAANIDLVMQRSSVIAHSIFARIRNPLTENFLSRARQRDNAWANQLVSRISAIVEDQVPMVWEVDVTPEDMPAFYRMADDDSPYPLYLADLYRDPRNRDEMLPCIPLLLKRGYDERLVPPDDTKIEHGDRLLFCGQDSARSNMLWNGRNYDVLLYVVTGEEHPSSTLGKWLEKRRQKRAPRVHHESTESH